MAAAIVNKRCRLLRLSLFHRELVHVSRLRVVLGDKSYAGVFAAVVVSFGFFVFLLRVRFLFCFSISVL